MITLRMCLIIQYPWPYQTTQTASLVEKNTIVKTGLKVLNVDKFLMAVL